MTVYVDRFIADYGKFWQGGGHLLTSDLEELHALAARIGLRRSWFQDELFPHYDLTASRRRAAIAAGAVEIEPGDFPADLLVRRHDGKHEQICRKTETTANMNLRHGVWMEIEPGKYIQDPTYRLWYVEDMRQGWLRLRNREGEYVSVPPKPLNTPVIFAEPTEEEALATLREVLGATEWGKIEALAKYQVRAEQTYFPTFGKKDTAINRDMARNHIFLAHGEYTDDVPDMNGLTECHNSLHSDKTLQMPIPHHHPISGSSSS